MTLTLARLGADSAEYPSFAVALADAGLRTGDLDGDARFFALEEDGRTVAFGGLEGDGPDQMIRSIVVLRQCQARSLGRDIVERLTMQARADAAARLWLLTTSAERFFSGLGWQVLDRGQAPAGVRDSCPFTDLCPSTAVLTWRRLA